MSQDLIVFFDTDIDNLEDKFDLGVISIGKHHSLGLSFDDSINWDWKKLQYALSEMLELPKESIKITDTVFVDKM